MKRAAQRYFASILAVPARFDDRRLVAGAFEGERQARLRWRWCESRDRLRAERMPGSAKATPSRSAIGRRAESTSTAVTSAPGSRAASAATSRPTMPLPMITMRSPGAALPSHKIFNAVSKLAVSTARLAGTPCRNRDHARPREPQNDPGADTSANTCCLRSCLRTGLDLADRRVAVFDRERENRPPAPAPASAPIRFSAPAPRRRAARSPGSIPNKGCAPARRRDRAGDG